MYIAIYTLRILYGNTIDLISIYLVILRLRLAVSQQTWGIHHMPFYCWSTVFDAGPTLNRHWVNALCFLGIWPLLLAAVVFWCCLSQLFFAVGLWFLLSRSVDYWLGWTSLLSVIRHSPHAVLMLIHRLRRWPNIKSTMGECQPRVFWVSGRCCWLLAAVVFCCWLSQLFFAVGLWFLLSRSVDYWLGWTSPLSWLPAVAHSVCCGS